MGQVAGLGVCVMFPDGVGCQVNLQVALVDGHFVFVAKDGGNFFQWQAIGVGEQEPHHCCSDGTGNDEAQVKLPADVDEGCVISC